MASVSTNASGQRKIQFAGLSGKRESIWLGKVPMKAAQVFASRVEGLLLAKQTGAPIDAETAAWLTKLAPTTLSKLAHHGLIRPPQETKLGVFFDAFLKSRDDAKPATRVIWQTAMNSLRAYFGNDRSVCTITRSDAEGFVRYLIAEGLASYTISKRLSFARQFFGELVKQDRLPKSPFAGVKSPGAPDPARQHFVTREVSEQVLRACHTLEWKLIFALSRFGGLRCPSETCSLRWENVDLDRRMMRVDSPKTERHQGGAWRDVPIFPELIDLLGEARRSAASNAVYVLDPKHREKALGGRGWKDCNMRSGLLKILKRAGITPWPKLLHNLRASRQTELEARFPGHVVCQWLGNSPKIARDHYLMVTPADFALAVRTPTGGQPASESTIPAAVREESRLHHSLNQNTPDIARNEAKELPTVASAESSKPLYHTELSTNHGNSEKTGGIPLVEAMGVEPTTSALRTLRSPN